MNAQVANTSGNFTLLGSSCEKELPSAFKRAKSLTMIEPTFGHFTSASNDSLSLPFILVTEHLADYKPDVMVIQVAEPQDNLRIAKGYLADMVGLLAGHYPEMDVARVNFPYLGAPIEGERLFLIASKEHTFSSQPRNYPAELYKDLYHHAGSGRASSNVNRGFGKLQNMVRSDKNLLPDLESWGGLPLMVEYLDGEVLNPQRLKSEHIKKLFGTSKEDFPTSKYHTPIEAMKGFYSMIQG